MTLHSAKDLMVNRFWSTSMISYLVRTSRSDRALLALQINLRQSVLVSD